MHPKPKKTISGGTRFTIELAVKGAADFPDERPA